MSFELFNNLDAPRPWGLYFQDTASPQMEALVELHDNIMFYLVIILFGVAWILLSIIRNYVSNKSPISNKYLNHGTLIELIWTITPGFILILIAFPSFKLLYLMDEVTDPSLTISAEGHQWYWSYQYPEFLNGDEEELEFDSYLVPESNGQTINHQADSSTPDLGDTPVSTGGDSGGYNAPAGGDGEDNNDGKDKLNDPLEGPSTNPHGIKRTAGEAEIAEAGPSNFKRPDIDNGSGSNDSSSMSYSSVSSDSLEDRETNSILLRRIKELSESVRKDNFQVKGRISNIVDDYEDAFSNYTRQVYKESELIRNAAKDKFLPDCVFGDRIQSALANVEMEKAEHKYNSRMLKALINEPSLSSEDKASMLEIKNNCHKNTKDLLHQIKISRTLYLNATQAERTITPTSSISYNESVNNDS